MTPDKKGMMKDPAVKIALAFCVLLTGICSASLFRRDSTQPVSPDPLPEEQLLIRHRADASPPTVRTRAVRKSAAAEPASSSSAPEQQPSTLLKPSERREPPPPLASDYPKTDRPASSRWGSSMDMMLPVAASTEDSMRTHKIVDGDTLASLAERFLGSSQRAKEIFDLNRDILLDPNLLPIGVVLKIPARRGETLSTSTPSSDDASRPPLTPVPNFQ